MNKKLTLIIIFLIILAGFFIRFYRLDLNIPSLYVDEANGIFDSGNLFEPSLLFLRLLRFTWFLDLTPLGVRLPSVLFGTLLLFLIFWLAKEINFEKKKDWQLIPLITLILAAFLPWGIHISRIGHTGVILSLLAVGIHWLIYLKATTIRAYIWSLMPLFLAAYCYASMILIGPFVLILVFIKIWQLTTSVKVKKTALIIGIILITFFGLMLFKMGNRGFDLAIWKDVNVTANENVDRGLARLSSPTIFSLNSNPELVSRLFYNRPIAVINSFTRTYLSFFSPDFLFLKGDPILRHSTGRFGVLYPFLLPFLVYGAFILFTRGEKKTKEMFLFWFLVTPIPAALTKDGSGYLLRVTYMLPLLTYLSALGIMEFLHLFEKKLKIILSVLLLIIFAFSTYSFLFNYFQVYPAKSARSFEYGFKELADFQKEKNDQSMLIIWDGYYPQAYFRFWQRTDYEKYLGNKISSITIGNSTFTKAFNNLYFSIPRGELDLTSFLNQNGISHLALPEDLKTKFQDYQIFQNTPEKTINYPDTSPAFGIFRVK
ncbi:hypothetical protein COT44_04790 [Candidatus Shapirobacteria bacterium CG08_land_8_20_14_0_20_39_18]|uniref:Glycosyltransferase RgtA/B/C/D-like domain-containing protein n=1 Tax=Candidatus Shapirobacteria bacterium CG08_land_8_20_14_0_20_39_18 TaxID=1974883 RepID=A0A2M6XC21_9BACT|nr:MAG: hypothetical protein COT44_04790 [Candidatus Shapirobacteria bacterium CG08_land_8_20_14_0_20_39_18]PIY65371.1 MAG: hypothetical protein COY91_03080 [Candidatus Shapirobacteria bacterium CG_4_10_14_0_8_um_filter_39_15]PJE68580.1 MAG: hypothetical protein COU94_01220 [Candidatus Shapirobacteria bacterium CG10_big_fil_rev_8_21_14_0_10_38_8]